jgi:CCR4-NOT complex subunit CAF16
MASRLAVAVEGLTFAYRPGEPAVLRDLSFAVGAGSRCLLAGPNGAGKTTLLRVLGGRHMVPEDQVRVLGRSAFHDTSLAGDVDFLGGVFAFYEDVRVGAVLDGVQGVAPDRRRRLVEVLGVDLDWHMHAVSDGQRKRVQIVLGLLKPKQLLLLDEITTDLDLIARQDLLAFLREESEERGTTIIYASHILDRLESWATHLAYMEAGRMRIHAGLGDIPELVASIEAGDSAPILSLLERWMKRDRR